MRNVYFIQLSKTSLFPGMDVSELYSNLFSVKLMHVILFIKYFFFKFPYILNNIYKTLNFSEYFVMSWIFWILQKLGYLFKLGICWTILFELVFFLKFCVILFNLKYVWGSFLYLQSLPIGLRRPSDCRGNTICSPRTFYLYVNLCIEVENMWHVLSYTSKRSQKNTIR